MKEIYVKNILKPILIILSINLLNYIYIIPVILQMIISAVLLVYTGCILSSPIQSATYK